MTEQSQAPTGRLVDAHPIGAFQKLIYFLSALCLVFDGFDVQSIGYVAPAIIDEWGVPRSSLAPVFSAGLFGLVIGALSLSALADRFGRRPMIILATAITGVGMCATSLVQNVEQLMVLRALTGIGMGGLMPNVLAITTEYTPSRYRTTAVMLMGGLFSAGAAFGGIAAGLVLPTLGWRMLFLLGGLAPLALAGVMLAALPESLEFLAVRGAPRAALERIARRLFPRAPLDPAQPLAPERKAEARVPIGELFRGGRAVATLIIWVIFFMNVLELYTLSNWLPTVVTGAGLSQGTAVAAGTFLQIGGVVGTILFAIAAPRLSLPIILGACFVLGATAIALIGWSLESATGLLIPVVALAGFCIVGGQPAANALAAAYYPTEVRATGVGWALGIGRIGSIVGPLLGGLLIAQEWEPQPMFLVTAIPAMVAAVSIAALAALWRRRATGAGQARPEPASSAK